MHITRDAPVSIVDSVVFPSTFNCICGVVLSLSMNGHNHCFDDSSFISSSPCGLISGNLLTTSILSFFRLLGTLSFLFELITLFLALDCRLLLYTNVLPKLESFRICWLAFFLAFRTALKYLSCFLFPLLIGKEKLREASRFLKLETESMILLLGLLVWPC